MNIGSTIKERRLEMGLTLEHCFFVTSLAQKQVAEKIMVSAKSISNWENGKNFPDIESLIRLAKLYGFSLDNLLLEGSAIVKDMKEKTEESELLRRINISSLIFGVIGIIIAGATVFGNISWQLQLGLFAVMALNMSNLIWFSNKYRKLKNISWKMEMKKKKKLMLLFAFFIIAAVFAGAAAYAGSGH